MHCLIIGANRGIGLALVEKYLAEGFQVTATCRESSRELNQTKATIIEGIDVTNETSFQRLAAEIDAIDIMIHSAGVLLGDRIERINLENIQKQFEVNTLAPLKSVLALKDKVKPGGKIGLMTSRMGSIADNTSGGQYGYRVSKAGLNAIGKSLAEDLRDENKAVFLLHPGYVRTEMTGGSGLIDPPESAEGLYQIMASKTLQQTGSFWHTNGEQLPW